MSPGTAYPLAWPEGWARTPPGKRRPWPGDVYLERAYQQLVWEVERLHGQSIVVSTNHPLRKDGYPRNRPDETGDPGVAVWFWLKKEQLCIACDRWDSTLGNMRALRSTIEALRGLDRWGSTEISRRTWQAFTALPPPGRASPRPWHEVLGVPPTADRDTVIRAYRKLAKARHPDHGGSDAQMAELNRAFQEARPA